LNMSKAIKNREHNSCLAEIIAAQTALKTLRNWKLYRDEAVILRTDFLPLVSAMNNSGYNGRFHEDYEVLKDEARKFPKGVEFEHVFGHEGEPGNEAVRNRLYFTSLAMIFKCSDRLWLRFGAAKLPPQSRYLIVYRAREK
uniref:RNase H domain-containing protein n=1 Tax=Toxocara canis TaxID=6265 RepID=A0A183VCY9_TOXCA